VSLHHVFFLFVSLHQAAPHVSRFWICYQVYHLIMLPVIFVIQTLVISWSISALANVFDYICSSLSCHIFCPFFVGSSLNQSLTSTRRIVFHVLHFDESRSVLELLHIFLMCILFSTFSVLFWIISANSTFLLLSARSSSGLFSSLFSRFFFCCCTSY
jgi:hypothetical protein